MNKLVLKLPGTTEEIGKTKELEKFKFSDATIGDIISALIPYIFTIAGLVLFIMLIMGGFGLLTSGGNPDKVNAAKGKLTSALIGFVIIFVSYWLMKILEIVFGIEII